ncbi:MAG TPA: hypothetical protein VN577_20235 [Terriglobales bacterium]|nr:hypothetical protein [Terriglobales bacterium]
MSDQTVKVKRMSVGKAVVRSNEGAKAVTSLRCTINGAHFHAEGDAKDVAAKFDEFLEKLFAPLRSKDA